MDTQPGAGNNALPAGSEVTIVIDHHTWREPAAAAAYVDVRPEAGATSTILTEYLQEAGLEPEPPLATVLFYGIKTDTRGLSRRTGRSHLRGRPRYPDLHPCRPGRTRARGRIGQFLGERLLSVHPPADATFQASDGWSAASTRRRTHSTPNHLNSWAFGVQCN